MDPNIPAGIFIGFAIWFLVRYLAGGIYTVDQNQRAVRTNFGRAERIPGAGREKCFSLDIPFNRTSGPKSFSQKHHCRQRIHATGQVTWAQ